MCDLRLRAIDNINLDISVSIRPMLEYLPSFRMFPYIFMAASYVSNYMSALWAHHVGLMGAQALPQFYYILHLVLKGVRR